MEQFGILYPRSAGIDVGSMLMVVKAVARKIAVIFYNMVLKQETYDSSKVQLDLELQKARKIARLQKEAQKLGLTLQNAA